MIEEEARLEGVRPPGAEGHAASRPAAGVGPQVLADALRPGAPLVLALRARRRPHGCRHPHGCRRAASRQVLVTQPAYVRLCASAARDMDNEVGGSLVGRWRVDRDSGAQFIVVEGVLPAPHTRQRKAFLTFTQDSQVAMQDAQEKRYPRKQVVGWFHTHPRMGSSFRSTTLWLHQHFIRNAGRWRW